MASTRSCGVLLLAAASLGAACSVGGQVASTEAPALTMPSDPTSVDVAMLRLDGPGERVLAEARGKPFITTQEYNAWLGSYPLNITEAEASNAQAQALDQMVDFRLLLERAVAAGYESGSGVSADAPSIVLRYVTDQIRNSAGVSDAAARRYREEHREELAGLDAPEVPPEIRLAAWKSAVRGAELAAALRKHREDAGVEILLASNSTERNRK